MLGSSDLSLDMLLNFAPNGRIFFLNAILVAMVLIWHKCDSNGSGRALTITGSGISGFCLILRLTTRSEVLDAQIAVLAALIQLQGIPAVFSSINVLLLLLLLTCKSCPIRMYQFLPPLMLQADKHLHGRFLALLWRRGSMDHGCFFLPELVPVCLGLGCGRISCLFLIGGDILGGKTHAFNGHSFASDVRWGTLGALTAHIVD